MTNYMAPSTERTAHGTGGSWSRWNASPGGSTRTAHRQAEYAQRIAMILNAGVLQDAVVLGLEDQGQFKIDVFSVLDALDVAGLKLVDDERREASRESTALIGTRHHEQGSRAGRPGRGLERR